MPLVKVRVYLAGQGIDVDLFLAQSRFQDSMMARRQRQTGEEIDLWIKNGRTAA
jgi:hypothetical protein